MLWPCSDREFDLAAVRGDTSGMAGFVGPLPPCWRPFLASSPGRAGDAGHRDAGIPSPSCRAPLGVLDALTSVCGRAGRGIAGAAGARDPRRAHLLRASRSVWALVFVRALGLGPGAGVLALAVTYGGMLGKVYTEILESGDTRSARALLEAGSPRLGALFYALVPSTAQELASYTVYRWECAVRASVVMGFVGAGGLGQLMDQSMKMLNGGEASTILLTFLLLVVAADVLSALIRRVLA